MKMFTGWEWLLIDAANQFGLDKLLFEERIQWAKDNLDNLENLVEQADSKTKPLFFKAVLAIRQAQKGLPTGHMVGVDACCSGIQVMSVLTGCIEGATATGLVDPDVRADAYAKTTEVMNDILGGGLVVSRSDAKQSLMTSFYGSKAMPKAIFGEDTVELNAFYQAANKVAPGAWELLQVLLASWRPMALDHSWKLPDGYDAVVRVMQKEDIRIEVDELAHATFTYEFYVNRGTKKGLSNVANVTHSVDAYVLRSMHRRCNYNEKMVKEAANLIEIELLQRNLGVESVALEPLNDTVMYYVEQYNRSTVADVVILPYLDEESVTFLTTPHLQKLAEIIWGMLQYKPFELVTVHDEFKAHPNNVNWVRWQYKEILAELAESNLVDDLLSQIYSFKDTFHKLSTNLGSLIRNSNYALC